MVLITVPAPPIVRAVLTGSELRLLAEDGGVVQSVPTPARELRWSPDGGTIALRAAEGKLTTILLGVGDLKPVAVAERVESFAWTRDGQLLLGLPGSGISLVGAGGGARTPLLPKAEFPIMSPDGTRLAFMVRGDGGGLWTAEGGGANPRRLVEAKAAAGASWSYDGRRIAWTDGGKLRLVRREGGAPQELGAVEDPRALWSPGSADLLARREGSWAVWSAGREMWTPLGARGAEPPVWNGPRDLLAVEDGHLLALRIGAAPRPIDLKGVRVIAAADVPSTFRGAAFPNPFRAAPRPASGEVAWQGRLLSFDPILGRVEALVESEISASGTTLVFGRPQARRAEVPDARLARRLSLPPETEIRITVREGRVVGAFLPGVSVATPAAPPVGRTLRPARVVESDGITREVVIAPLVYPIPGKHSFVDTFLAPRGGGTRRHHGNDLMAPKMTPLVAVFDGTVSFARSSYPGASNSLSLRSDDGWTASYLHVNNDTPGTDDGAGSLRYAFPADLQPGDRVRAGEVVAWCGDSGNAEDTGSHLHFELFDGDGRAIVNPAPSLRAARRIEAPLFPDPDPSLKPKKGEARWEGVVIDLQVEKRALTVELTGIAAPGEEPRRNLSPRIVYLDLPPGMTLRYRGEGDVRYPLDVARPGLRIGAAGTVTGAKMRVRQATISLGAR